MTEPRPEIRYTKFSFDDEGNCYAWGSEQGDTTPTVLEKIQRPARASRSTGGRFGEMESNVLLEGYGSLQYVKDRVCHRSNQDN